MFCKLDNVRLGAIRSCVPANEIALADEVHYYDGALKKVKRLTAAIGMDRRRICPPGVTAADLCFQAAGELLDADALDRGTIDALLFLSQTPDYPMPATACALQDRLGLPTSCATLDLSQGCTGYIYGLWTAAALVASGACRRVLLLCGDSVHNINLANRVVAPVFGHGGSATLLESAPGAPPMFFGLHTDGTGFETIIRPAGGARRPFSLSAEADRVLYEDVYDSEGNPWRLTQAYMDGRAVFDFTQRVVPAHIRDFMQRCEVTAADIAALFLHQANGQIVELVAEKAGFTVNADLSRSFCKYGNLTCASIPVQICEIFGNARQHGGLMLCCGYGVGFSWGSALMDMTGLRTGAVADYSGTVPENYEQEYLQHWFGVFEGKK